MFYALIWNSMKRAVAAVDIDAFNPLISPAVMVVENRAEASFFNGFWRSW